MLTHFCHEIVQAIWLLLLDDDLMHAYEVREAIKLFDDVLHAMFPRFLFYSTDYPAKWVQCFFLINGAHVLSRALMSCIKFLGKCMCPWCLLLKEKVQLVGSKSDMQNWIKFAQVDSKPCQFDIEQVRQLLFERGLSLTSKAVKAILDPISAVPTQVRSLFFPYLQIFIPSIECLLWMSFQIFFQFLLSIYCWFHAWDWDW